MSFNEKNNFPDTWQMKSLEECVDLIIDYRGKTPKKLGGDWSESGFRAFSAKNIKDGKIVRKDTIRYLEKGLYEKWMKEEIKKNDILMTSEAPLGETLLWDSEEKIVLSQRLYGIRANDKIIYPKYLFSYMTSPKYKAELDGRASGTTVVGIRQTELLKTNIILPRMNEQIAIGNFICNLDKKIEINNKINKKLDELAQAIFKQWFIDFDFPNEDGEPYKSSSGEMVESEVGMIPKMWQVKELREIIKFIKGKKPKEISDSKFENCKKYLTIDALNGNNTQFAINDKVVLADKKDILMVMDGASSGALYYGMDGVVGSTLAKISLSNQEINEDILYYFLKLNEPNIKAHLTGSAIPHTDKEFVNRLIITIPKEKALLNNITKILSDFRNEIIVIKEENNKLIRLRHILLPKLISGEIRLPLDK